MSAVLDFLEGFGNAIISIFEFLIDFLADLVYVVTLIGEKITELPLYFSWLPEEAVVALVSLFGIVAIYKIVGREG